MSMMVVDVRKYTFVVECVSAHKIQETTQNLLFSAVVIDSCMQTHMVCIFTKVNFWAARGHNMISSARSEFLP